MGHMGVVEQSGAKTSRLVATHSWKTSRVESFCSTSQNSIFLHLYSTLKIKIKKKKKIGRFFNYKFHFVIPNKLRMLC